MALDSGFVGNVKKKNYVRTIDLPGEMALFRYTKNNLHSVHTL